MKTLLILTLILSLSAAWAKGKKGQDETFDGNDSGSCDIGAIVVDIQSLFEVKCLVNGQSNKERCKCLEEAAKDNYLVQEILNKKNDDSALILKRENARAKLTNQFMDVYSQMTVEASAQTQIMGMDKNDKGSLIVGCPAKEVSGEIAKETLNAKNNQVKALQDLLAETEDEISKCDKKNLFGGAFLVKKRDCPALEEQKNRIKAQLAISQPTTQSCTETIAFLRTDTFKEVLPELKAEANIFGATVLSVIEKVVNSENVTDKELNDAVEKLLGTSTSRDGSVAHKTESACKRFFTGVNAIVEKQLLKKSKSRAVDHQCGDDVFCKTVANTNQALQNKVAEKFSHKPQEECISFAEFKTYKSMPSEAMLNEIRSSNRSARHILEFPDDDDTLNRDDRIRFLRSNPLLGKLASNKDYKKRLSSAMKEFARKLPPNASEPERMSAYLKFMKGPVKDMLNEPEMKNTEQFVCKTMIDNFTAIQVAQDIPGTEEKDDPEATKMNLLFKGVNTCRAMKYNKTASITNLDATLKASPIFMLGAPEAQSEEKALDIAFKDYKAKHCADYPKKIAECKDKSEKGIEDCRQKYLGTKDFGLVEKAMATYDAGKSLTKDMMERIADYADPLRQDNGFKEYWYKAVAPTMPGVLAPRGHEAQYGQQMASYQTTATETKVPEKYHNSRASSVAETSSSTNSLSSSTSRSPANTSSVNEGQEQPTFLNQPQSPVASPVTLNPAMFNTATSVQQLNPQYPQMQPEEKVKYLNSLQNYAQTLPNKEEIEKNLGLSDELEKATDELAEEEKITKKAEEELKDTPRVASGAVSSSIPSSNIAGSYNMSSGNAGGSSAARKVSIDPVKQKKDGVNDALNTIHDQQNPGRDVASVNADLSIVIQKSDADPKTLSAPYKVTEEISAVSTAMYLELKQDANKLAEFIASKIDASKVKDAQIISIKDPGSVKHMLFKVSKTGSKSLALEMWPSDVEVQRSRTLSGMQATIKGATK